MRRPLPAPIPAVPRGDALSGIAPRVAGRVGTGRHHVRLIAFLALMLASGGAGAETRGFTITDFDRIRLSGPYEVTVRTGPAVSARAEGTYDALDRARLSVQGGTLTISLDRTQAGFGAGAAPGKLRLLLTAPRLRGVTVTGSGSVAVDAISAPAVTLGVAGAGSLRVAAVKTDRLSATLVGPGGITLGGKAATGQLTVQGAGRIDATALTVTDAGVALTGAGAIVLTGGRTAKVTAAGGGDVTVLGRPACTVRDDGAGDVTCGGGGAPG